MATTLRMEIDELNTINSQIETYMETVGTEVDSYAQILIEFEENDYMRGCVEATQLIRDRVVTAQADLTAAIASFVTLVSEATTRSAETEDEFNERFQNLTGDDFSQDSSVAPVVDMTNVPIAGVDLSGHIPGGDTSFKSYQGYSFHQLSGQYKLQQDPNTYTDQNGLRRNGDDYIIALGSAFGTEIGTRYRITLDTGQTFTALLGDSKNPSDGNAVRNGSGQSVGHRSSSGVNIVEFIVDKNKLDPTVRSSGTIGSIPQFSGNVVSIEQIGKYGDFPWG